MATIYFSATAMRLLFEGSAYSRVTLNFVTCTHNLVPSTFTYQFPADAMTDHEEFMLSYAVSCVQVYLVGRLKKAA